MITQMKNESDFRENYDCVVIGGGPGGCTTAALVAEQGHSVLLLEREQVPRFHVGESLMPEIYWTLQRLGLLDTMKELGFVSKVGVQFVSHSGKESQPFFFNEHDERECARTWHVERGKFDKMLFDRAADLGADCRDETRVTNVDISKNGGESVVAVQSKSGAKQDVKARVVVDATGQSAMLANRLGLMQENKQLRKASIWTYFKGAARCEDGCNTTVILHTEDKSAWFWYIPLSDDVVSVGVVSDNDYLLKGGSSTAETFWNEVERCSAVKARIQNAEQCDKLHVAKEFSYTTSQHAGDGWLLVGDAFGFIDPVYSSGVFLALKSGELAADAISQGLTSNDLSANQLGGWTHEFKDGIHWIRKLVHAFYTNEFSFGRFMKDHPQFKGNLTDLLIGRVFTEGVGEIFAQMDPAIQSAISPSANK